MSDKTRTLIDDIARPILAVIFSTVTVLIFLTGLSAAWACDMEEEVTVLSGERFSFETERMDMDVNTARDWFQWIHRTEQLLPDGKTLYTSAHGAVLLCGKTRCDSIPHQLQETTPEEVFHMIATSTHTEAQKVTRIAAQEIPLWTIQVASTPFYLGAQDLITTLPGGNITPELSANGMYGGVLSEPCARGGTCYKVLTGAYTTRAQAVKALAKLKAHGSDGYVRRL